MKKIKIIAGVMLVGSFLYGGTFTWTGPAGGLWSDSSCWSPEGVPASEDDVILTQQNSATVSGAVAAVKSVTINLKTATGGITVESAKGSRLEIAGDLSQNGGGIMIRRIDPEAPVVIGGNYNATRGAVTVLQNVTLSVGGNLTAGKNFKFRFPLNKSKAFGTIHVNGAVDLGGAKLELFQMEGSPCNALKLPLILNSSATELIGTFENAPFDSSVYTINDRQYTLKLGDCDGGGVNNDVYLETVSQ